jgi:DNA polymerase III epsilon subunit-like protein
MRYELYCVDTETTGTDPTVHSPIEISIYRLSTNEQATWCLQPLDMAHISADALRVNGAKLEDLQGFTKEGRDKYQSPSKVLVEIENWLMNDACTSMDRLLLGQNISFDKEMMLRLWERVGSAGTFPFNHKYGLDTMGMELVLDLARGEEAEGYSLRNLTKKYAVKNDKAHSAASDVLATVEVFRKQLAFLQSVMPAKSDE